MSIINFIKTVFLSSINVSLDITWPIILSRKINELNESATYTLK